METLNEHTSNILKVDKSDGQPHLLQQNTKFRPYSGRLRNYEKPSLEDQVPLDQQLY